MQDKTVDEMIKIIKDALKRHFGNRITSGFTITDVNEDVNHKEFSIQVTLYDYYRIYINYDKFIGACIATGDVGVGLKNSQNDWSQDDFDIDLFMEEMKKEIELRIPDKYLKAKGWL